MFAKIKDSILVLICTIYCPYVLQMFRFPVTLKEQVGFGIIGLAAILYVITAQPAAEPEEPEDKITETLKRRGVSVKDDKEVYLPIFVGKSKEGGN